MSQDTETVLDRRRLRRRLALWRAAAIAGLALVIGSLAFGASGSRPRRTPADRPRHHRGHDHRGPRSARAAEEAQGRQERRGRARVRQQPRRHDDRRRRPVRGAARRRQEEAGRRPVRHRRGLGRLHRRPRHRPHRRARQHDHRLGRRDHPVAGGERSCWTSSASSSTRSRAASSRPARRPSSRSTRRRARSCRTMIDEGFRWFSRWSRTGAASTPRRRPGPLDGPRLLRPRGARAQARRRDRRRGRGGALARGEAQRHQGPQGRRLEAEAGRAAGACSSAIFGGCRAV